MKRRITRDEMNKRTRLNNTPDSGFQNKIFRFSYKWWIVVGLVVIIFIILFNFMTRDLPTLEQLERYEQKFSTKLYSRDNQLLKELYFIKRTYTPLDSIPPNLVNSVIATEDREFYSHWGFNSKRFFKAMLIDVIAMHYKQGASTLSQQLARGLFLTKEKKITRKLKELLLAIQIEYTYTKNEILEMYVNHMYFGHGAYGVQAAALKYFGKNVFNLNLQECALLTALLQRPNYYSPYRNMDAAIKRRNVVIRNLLVCNYISAEQYETAVNSPIELKEFNAKEEMGIAPYFTENVRQYLNDKYGVGIYTDGYSVYTTIDSRMQAAAEKSMREHIQENQDKLVTSLKRNRKFLDFLDPEYVKNRGVKNIIADEAFVDSVINANAIAQVGLVAIEPSTGYILAMIGGRDFEESKWNRVTQTRRQPGSAFKPIAFATAIENGYSPSTELLNQPVVLYMDNGDVWKPRNYDHSEGGPTTLREGLRKSYNLIAARLIQELVPPAEVVKFARELGITSHLDAVDALALGSCGVTVLELTSAYGVFANKGILAKPMSIIRVEDKYGNVLEENFPVIREAMREEVAYVMTNMLETVINHGTGVGARYRYNFMRPAAGKTGTTNDYTDGWFVGYTPEVVAGVWCGVDDPQISLGPRQEGARVALPIWAPFMKMAHDTMLVTTHDTLKWGFNNKFIRPFNVVEVEICADTKKLANESCPHRIKEIFIRNNVPKEHCDMHVAERKSSQRRHY